MDAMQLMTFLSPTAPRRLRVIENILVGKRTVSTLYWGMRYQQLSWLGYEKKLTREVMDQAVTELTAKGWVNLVQTNAQLTDQGGAARQKLMQNRYQPRCLNLRLVVDIETFWQRFLLATQVVSEQSYQNYHYYPLQVSWQVKQSVKRWFSRFHEADLSSQFYSFWQHFFRQLPDSQAAFMSRLLVGHQRPGETRLQVARDFGLSEAEAGVMATDLVCQLARAVSQTQLASVNSLLTGLKRSLISTSAQQTLTSFMAGDSLTVISRKRALKLSTVREHLLEAAIMLPKEQFDFQRVLPLKLVTEVQRRFVDTPLDEWQFKQVGDLSIEFWQFRLIEILRSKQTDDQH
ncbi:hypothetical protein IWT25_01213 [Secundilactobacillus pentosiphilus]|uniref:Helicase Helix-turn-helix domain-containing protein n=1 Tax=Secundilactobacillus pentosiphilus TaxID=1714682 RepID=A0A1Z5IWB8_9LACO|nr:helix-turn-helix domain-containing protein [Secundilactobacillus pentosiphilus]GAX05888.1 hypothetical protein IWT25_01213 [Secundilactobacillus pentosiphilus]